MKINLLLFFIVIFITCCSNSNVNSFNNSSELSFENVVKLFENEKYLRAKEEFAFLIFNNPGSKDAIDSQFYYAECLFHLKNYSDAIKEYQKYISISTDFHLIKISKYLICRCYFELSLEFDKDQRNTKTAIDKSQQFIEEYIDSKHKSVELHNKKVNLISFTENMIKDLRAKLAKKNFESGKLYMRIEEYDAALTYFNLILMEYYDSPLVDDAMFNIVMTNILKGDESEAVEYFELHKTDFISNEKLLSTKQLLENTKSMDKSSHYILGILIGSYILQLNLSK